MSNVSPYDVEDNDLVQAIRIHDEYHAVALVDEPLPEAISPPEQCDGCGSTVTEEEAAQREDVRAGDAWSLLLNEQGAYECSRHECGHVYRVFHHRVADTVL